MDSDVYISLLDCFYSSVKSFFFTIQFSSKLSTLAPSCRDQGDRGYNLEPRAAHNLAEVFILALISDIRCFTVLQNGIYVGRDSNPQISPFAL